jgi:hypothetical protein
VVGFLVQQPPASGEDQNDRCHRAPERRQLHRTVQTEKPQRKSGRARGKHTGGIRAFRGHRSSLAFLCQEFKPQLATKIHAQARVRRNIAPGSDGHVVMA